MPYLYLFLTVFLSASTNVLGKIFNKSNSEKKDATVFFNFLLTISVLLCWAALYIADFSFEIAVLWYSLLFSICYTAYNIGIISALKYGPTMLTSLFTGLSLILTTVWGLIFWDAELTVLVAVGLILVAVAIFLCLYVKKEEEKTLSWKWLIFVLLAFFGNAGCSIIQRTQQIQYNGMHGNMMMLFASAFSVVGSAVIYLKKYKESITETEYQQDTEDMLKKSGWLPLLAGALNVALNALVMLLAMTKLSPSFIYPTIGVGSLGVVTIFSLYIFKEKMYWWQWIGVLIGAMAVVLLSL